MARKLVPGEKQLFWMGSSHEELTSFPERVKDDIGWALGVAQFGEKHPSAKPWKGEGPGVFEVVDDYAGDTYRAVYTVRFGWAVYVLHAFQKKSPRGVRTAKSDVELIHKRLQAAHEHYRINFEEKSSASRKKH